MKKLSNLLLIIAAAAFVFVACEGPTGPDGPTGPAGADGANGTAGVAGVTGAQGPQGETGADGTTSCIECHNDSQTIASKTKQYENSAHSMGETSGYTNRSFGPLYNCASCHTSQGYLDNLTGLSNTPYANVTQPNCYTCHEIHASGDMDDWALKQLTAVTPSTGTAGVDMGAGNQCAYCHQFVASYTVGNPTNFADFDDGGSTTVTTVYDADKRTGVHHAPQYNIFAGIDLFEFTSGTGSVAYPTSENHLMAKTDDGCVTCHMNDGFGDLTGHSMAMTYDFHGENYNWPASCLVCHVPDGGGMGNDLDTKVGETGTLTVEIQGLLDDLKVLLAAQSVTDPDDYLLGGDHTTEQMAAHVNYNAVREDKSLGMHNPKYIRAVLGNTIKALETAPTK